MAYTPKKKSAEERTAKKVADTQEAQSIRDRVVATILEAMKKNVAPWTMPWLVNGYARPVSVSGRYYRGVNSIVLSFIASEREYIGNIWGVYGALKRNGGQVRKGEKSTIVMYLHFITKQDANGKPVLGADGKPVTIPVRKFHRVFHIDQCDWAENTKPVTPEAQERTEKERLDSAEEIVSTYFGRDGAPTITYTGSKAFYVPKTDSVTVPVFEDFINAEGYYATTFHEMTHSTGHAKRLNRKGVAECGVFGAESYAFEELVAEFGAAMLTAHAGIANDAGLANNTSYIKNWAKRLENDAQLLLDAAGQAADATKFILDGFITEATEEEEK